MASHPNGDIFLSSHTNQSKKPPFPSSMDFWPSGNFHTKQHFNLYLCSRTRKCLQKFIRELNPKISDFGLAKLDEDDNTHISTRVAGTRGYMAPEYALWGHLTSKADVYSFGIVVLEIVAGKNNMNSESPETCVSLRDKALVLQQTDEILDLVDPKLGSNYNIEEATKMIKVGLLCTNPTPTLRPAMSSIVSMLEGTISIPEDVDESSYDDQSFKSAKGRNAKLQAHNYEYSTTGSLSDASSSNAPYDVSSAPGKDLYSIGSSFIDMHSVSYPSQ